MFDPTPTPISGTPNSLDVLAPQSQEAVLVDLLHTKLQQAAHSPELFTQVFGDKANTPEIQAVRSAWSGGDFSVFPALHILSADNMNGAAGAYAHATGSIYLSDGLFKPGAPARDALTGAVGIGVEEAFHWLDDRVGTDTPGDEGELARNVVFGVNLNGAELARIKSEDDRGFITVNEQKLLVEQALFIPGTNASDTLNGTNWDDVIYGYDGNDYIYANGGNDSVYGGGNDDRIWGGSGNDKLWGEDGADQLRGDDGNDELRGGNGSPGSLVIRITNLRKQRVV